jgi:hypothetical protein
LFLPFILQKFSFTEMYGFLFIPIGVILLITFAVYNKLDTWKSLLYGF